LFHGSLARLRLCRNFQRRVGTFDRHLSRPILALLIPLFNSILISNIYNSQMAREKRGNKRATTLEIDSSPSSNSEATEEVSPVVQRTAKRKVVAKVPLRSRGRGRSNP
jgi:hypothetical protein